MSIHGPEQLEKLRACGQIVAKALRAMSNAVRPGVTTAELSKIGSRILAENGAQSSLLLSTISLVTSASASTTKSSTASPARAPSNPAI